MKRFFIVLYLCIIFIQSSYAQLGLVSDDFDSIPDLKVVMWADDIDQRGEASDPDSGDAITNTQTGFWWYAYAGEYGPENSDKWAFTAGPDDPITWHTEQTTGGKSAFRILPDGKTANADNAYFDSDNASAEEKTPWNMHGYSRFTFFAYVYCRNGVGDDIMPIFLTTDYLNSAGRSGVKFWYDSREETGGDDEDFFFDVGNSTLRVVTAGTGNNSAPDSTWYGFMAVYDSSLSTGTLKLYLDDPVTPISTGNKSNEGCYRCDSFSDPYLGYTDWGATGQPDEEWGDFDIYIFGWYADTLSVEERSFVMEKMACLADNDCVEPGGNLVRRRGLRRNY